MKANDWGGFSDYKYNREGVDLLLACFHIYHISKKMICIGCISITKNASHLQKWLLEFKNCVSFTNIWLSIYKIAFCITKLHLGLQLSKYYILFSCFCKYKSQNRKYLSKYNKKLLQNNWSGGIVCSTTWDVVKGCYRLHYKLLHMKWKSLLEGE